jgi:aerobic carbon-monoxide dehydrogenase medium subunit
MKPAPFSYSRPETVPATLEALRQPEVRVIAGGQSLGPMLNFRLVQPRQLIDISRIDALCMAATEGDILAIGACITHAAIEDGGIPDVTLGLMRHVAAGIAYRAVRNRGTIGGSLAHADPAADWLLAMIALDASVRLQGATAMRQLKVVDFVVGALDTQMADGELITHVLVPRLPARARWGHAKYSKKPGDFAESAAISVFHGEGGVARVVLGRRAEPPVLMQHASAQLAADRGKPSGGAEAAVEADLRSLGVKASDWTMHRAIVMRALWSMTA